MKIQRAGKFTNDKKANLNCMAASKIGRHVPVRSRKVLYIFIYGIIIHVLYDIIKLEMMQKY